MLLYRVYRVIPSKRDAGSPLRQIVGEFLTQEGAQREIERCQEFLKYKEKLPSLDELEKERKQTGKMVTYYNFPINYVVEELGC